MNCFNIKKKNTIKLEFNSKILLPPSLRKYEIIDELTQQDKFFFILKKKNKKFFLKETYNYDLFLNEATYIKSLSHINIIKCIDNIIYNNKYYLLTENGNYDLYKFINLHNKPIENNLIIVILRQLNSVIKYLHLENSICHRDIKLENIILFDNNLIKLIDFEYAKTFKTKITKEKLGTAYYCCPELILNSECNPYLADMWAIGVCLYILSQYDYPFDRGTYFGIDSIIIKKPNIINKFRQNNIIYKREITDNLKNIIDNLLNTNIAKRWNITHLDKYLSNY